MNTSSDMVASTGFSLNRGTALPRPVYLLTVTIGGIFLAEAAIMLALSQLPTMTKYQEAAFDALSLSVIIFPLLYFLVFRPMKRVIDRYKQALVEVTTLRGIVPICSSCKKVRDDEGFWQGVETYISNRSDAQFSHGLCPDCIRTLYPDVAEKVTDQIV